LELTGIRWLYLIFFNGLWVVIPGWLLWEAYWEMVPAVEMMQAIDVTEDEKKVN
jgi:hypothetical protein